MFQGSDDYLHWKRALIVHMAVEIKITSFPTCNQMFIKDKFLGDHIFYILEQFCKNEYNETGFCS